MVLAWLVALYVPALLIAATTNIGAANPFVAMWELTDAVDIIVKLGFALVFSAFVMAGRLIPLGPRTRMIADALLGVAAMALLLALIPADWSRGFGIGLTGARFDPATLPSYLFGGLLAGLLFTTADARCGELRTPRSEDA